MSKATAYYVRVSTSQQSTESQMPDLKRHAAQHAGDCLWFTDKSSGKTMNRPSWNKLQDAINAGKIGVLVVWRLDRLGRTAKGLTTLFENLQECKVNLVSIRDGVDLATTTGRLVANIMASVAAYETEVRAERVAAGQAVARAAGKRWGGSTRGRSTKATATVEQIEAIQKMRKEGKKITAIARATGVARTTVYRHLRPERKGG